jgi:hypothetical protein
MFTYSDDCFSDLFKDVNGFRPRGSLMDDWNDRTPRQKQELWNALCDELEENSKREKDEAAEAVDAFENTVQTFITFGAGDRVNALRWMTQNEVFNHSQDIEHFVWNQGILFTEYGKQLVADLINIIKFKDCYN